MAAVQDSECTEMSKIEGGESGGLQITVVRLSGSSTVVEMPHDAAVRDIITAAGLKGTRVRMGDEVLENTQAISDTGIVQGAVLYEEDLPQCVGRFECHMYDKGGKNDWHYVTITETAPEEYLWRNKAGVEWKLKGTADPNVLAVGRDCPYYKDGHTKAIIERHPNGAVLLIRGPWKEPYDYEGPF
eukprot:Sspe_Gene.118210::Locus_111052_Transcript_1_1_Confidence_1.000_Length_902::g.118210::m.118210